MKIINRLKIVLHLGCFLVLFSVLAQEDKINVEESAAVFLEEYSDNFQEQFFEGLKQKGIENYDKAIKYFLKCKEIDAESTVVSHELAKVYLLNKEYINAQNYALEALNKEPENLWYLYTLVTAMQSQGGTVGSLTQSMPYENIILRENLGKIYYSQKNYKGALAALEGIKKSKKQQDLYTKIEEAVKKQEEEKTSVSYTVTNTVSTTRTKTDNGVQAYKARLKGLISIKAYSIIKQVATEAVEQYPLQPYFYYTQAYALNQTKRYREAIAILEVSLDYLVDDISLANKIYKELANGYTGLNQTSRANMYLRKIKPGF
ncbi:hypothetical protein [uncultured Maribacter sp.]|uniref:tetratricopeptide repeat protein n=1 Tax=uncultured Maribacter sp. TaxID=431308 RepID=UPI00260E1749|nr:hypothetical protein [uncultured Maribacter sp.]